MIPPIHSWATHVCSGVSIEAYLGMPESIAVGVKYGWQMRSICHHIQERKHQHETPTRDAGRILIFSFRKSTSNVSSNSHATKKKGR